MAVETGGWEKRVSWLISTYHKTSVHCPSFLELQKGICKSIFWPIGKGV